MDYLAGLVSGGVVALITWFLSYRSDHKHWRLDHQEPIFAEFLRIAERMVRDVIWLARIDTAGAPGRTERLVRLDTSLDDMELARCSIDSLSKRVFREEAYRMRLSLESAMGAVARGDDPTADLDEFAGHRAAFVQASRAYLKAED